MSKQTDVLTDRRPRVGDMAPDLMVTEAVGGRPFPLADLWKDGPALLVFLRHLGCSFCREQVSNLKDDIDRFRALNTTIGLITPVGIVDADQFCDRRNITGAMLCLSDSERTAYAAFGLAQVYLGDLFAPSVVGRGIQAALHGHFVGMPKGDIFQMPGVFIVDTAGAVRYAHRHKDISDNPANADLLAALEALA